MAVGLLSFASGPRVKRSTLNVNFQNGFEYLFINHYLNGDSYGPVGTAYAAGDPWNKNLDSNGWPNETTAYDSRTWGVGVRIPASTDFAGPYVLTWTGNGEVFLNNGTWTIDAGQSSNYTAVSASRWHGTNSRIVLNYSGARLLFSIHSLRTNRDGSGNLLKNIKFYRLEDEADLLAGKVFRSGWKQELVDLNPGALRFMNWTGQNHSRQTWFTHRMPPTYASYGSSSNWTVSPPYPVSTGTNAIAVASATGMPVAMTHGEVVTCRIGNATVRNGSKTVTAITKANPGVVTATAHGFNTGDVIVHQITAGMAQLDYRPCTITVSDANTYSLGVDTTAFTTFTAGTAKQYITLNVGSRGEYPVVFGDAITPASNYGDGYIAANDYKTFVFDKELVASTTITGAWTFNDLGAANGHEGNPPLEICTALVNELMAMTRSDGRTVGPIDMWVTIPHRGMLSTDPDYSSALNWAVKAVDVIYNGANGYSGLDSRCNLIVEFSNETWNSGGSAFDQTNFLARKGQLRYGGSASDFSSYTTLRAVIMVNDIKASFPPASYPRIKYAMCGQGTLGISGTNSVRINGNANYDGDALNVWGGDPITHFDAFAWAAYLLAHSSFETANLANYVASWLAAPTAADKEAVCALYVEGIIGTGSNETISRYGGTLLPAYATAMTAVGKETWMYEGGWDRAISGSTDTQNFLTACKQSQAWANALRDFFDMFDGVAGAKYPADYIELDARWGHASPDLYSGGVEGAALDLAWQAIALRNRR